MHLYNRAIKKSCCSTPRYYHSDMLNITKIFTQRLAYIGRPLPTRHTSRTAYGHTAKGQRFKFAFVKGSDFIRVIKILSILGYQTVISPYSKALELLIYAILGKVVPLIGAVFSRENFVVSQAHSIKQNVSLT